MFKLLTSKSKKKNGRKSYFTEITLVFPGFGQNTKKWNVPGKFFVHLKKNRNSSM